MQELALAKHFASLLHLSDWMKAVDQDIASPDMTSSISERFESWWLVKGRAQYPYWSYLSDDEKAWLSESVGELNLHQLKLPLIRALSLIMTLRPDVIAKFSERQGDGSYDPNAVAGWYFSSGVYEHLFSELITLASIRDLDRPILLEAKEEVEPLGGIPQVSVLMFLVWSMLERSMQDQMDLHQTKGRYYFLAWFFSSALKIFKLDRLITSRWKLWLQENLIIGSSKAAIPRFAMLAYSLSKPTDRPKLETPLGAKQLLDWSASQLSAKGAWHWLLEPSLSPVKLPKIFDPTQKSEDENTKRAKPFGLNLIGFAYGELGIGEDIRMAVAACEAAKIPYKIVNISPGDDVRQNDLTLKERIEGVKEQTRYAINVFIMPGFDMVSRLFLRQGNEVFDGYYNIGWWPWELAVWPKAWDRAFDLVDEVWAGSQFSFEMYKASTNKPISLMPLAVSVANVKTLDRKHFNLPEDSYLFLYIFDFNSHLKRKNPEAAIEAFQKAFPMKSSKVKGKASTPSKVGLVLKVMNTKLKDPKWLAFEKICVEDERIQIINQTLDREEILGLIQTCDAYVSPHRAEGFGRTLAEAMLLGKPVIATNYSGNAFYMEPTLTLPVDYDLVPAREGDYHFVENEDQAVWAEPSIHHMAKQMALAMKKSQDETHFTKLKEWAQGQFDPARTGKIIKKRLTAIKAILSKSGVLI